MYAAFFGLSQPPFSIAPDPRYLFMSERHQEALAHLLYGIESGGGFVLLTGEIGAGKTTVCRRFLEHLPEYARVAYVFNPQMTVGDLLQTICQEFGVAVPWKGAGPATIKAHIDALNAHLLASHAQGLHSVLIIDEAQSLSGEVLEQLRLLTNLETNERKLLQIVLIGQPELRDMLARPELEQLAQRVIARFHLGALSEAETRQYVAHRMGVAGWQGPLPFTPGALGQVHRLTGGVPRRINLLCDRALLGAYAGGKKTVEKSTVNQAAGEVFDRQAAPVPRRFGWKALTAGAIMGALIAASAAILWRPNFPSTAALMAAPAAEQPPTESPPTSAAAPTLPASQAESPPNLTPPARQPAQPAAASKKLQEGLPPQSAWFPEENQAFSALGPLWGAALKTEQACSDARDQGLQCYRTPRMTRNGLRQLDRPAALKLYLPGQGAGYVLATAINGNEIELLDARQGRWKAPMSALDNIWQGYYASLWRTPPGQQGRLNNGYQGAAAAWMEARLTALQTRKELPASAKTLKDKVEAFQRANGIEVNGIASPTTLILINRASGVDEPRLVRNSP